MEDQYTQACIFFMTLFYTCSVFLLGLFFGRLKNKQKAPLMNKEETIAKLKDVINRSEKFLKEMEHESSSDPSRD